MTISFLTEFVDSFWEIGFFGRKRYALYMFPFLENLGKRIQQKKIASVEAKNTLDIGSFPEPVQGFLRDLKDVEAEKKALHTEINEFYSGINIDEHLSDRSDVEKIKHNQICEAWQERENDLVARELLALSQAQKAVSDSGDRLLVEKYRQYLKTKRDKLEEISPANPQKN